MSEKNKNRIIVRFLAEVNQQSSNALIKVVENLINQGTKNILLLISSSGGSVFHGVSTYNFLKNAPIHVDTCNFGSVDSIASVIYCAGENRYSMPNSRFLIHSINWSSSSPVRFEEKKLKELVASLKIDRENIAKIIAENCKKEQSVVEKKMFNGTTYNPEEAKEFGLVTEITNKLFEEGEQIIGIK
jgi:ATP-dependent protease ClpP protease subunit